MNGSVESSRVELNFFDSFRSLTGMKPQLLFLYVASARYQKKDAFFTSHSVTKYIDAIERYETMKIV